MDYGNGYGKSLLESYFTTPRDYFPHFMHIHVKRTQECDF